MCDEALVAFRGAGIPERDLDVVHARFHDTQLTIPETVHLYPEADAYRKAYGTTLSTALRYMALWQVRWRGQDKPTGL